MSTSKIDNHHSQIIRSPDHPISGPAGAHLPVSVIGGSDVEVDERAKASGDPVVDTQPLHRPLTPPCHTSLYRLWANLTLRIREIQCRVTSGPAPTYETGGPTLV